MPPLKDVLGKPGEGVHFHVAGIAILDVLATIALGCLLGWLCWKQSTRKPALWGFMLSSVVMLFVLGEVLHLLFGVDTTVVKWLRGKP